MRLAEYITANMETLLGEWETFARSVQPLPAHLGDEELRDWAGQMLEAIAEDLDLPQTEAEESLRSKGVSAMHERLSDCGYEHASERLMHGFTLEQVTAEFRALRASVLRSCIRATAEHERATLVPQLFRFDQALDEAFAASMREYTRRLERSRHLVLGALGHDLRSPLLAISTGVEYLLISGENLSHEQTKTLIRLRNSVNRMTKMIADILDFTRTRLGGSLPISLDHMDLGETLRLVIDELRSYHPGRALTLDMSGDLRGTWDQTRIEQVATNLIANALQYSPPGSTVTVVARDAGEEVTFSVHNSGEPIPHEARSVLFDPLVRGGPEARTLRSRQSGVGLGLYIAKQIAETHSGRIELDSSEEAGTTFKVSLPRRRATPRQASQLQPA